MKCGGDLAAQINLALATHSEVDEPYGYVTMEEAQAMLGPEGVGNEIDEDEQRQLEDLTLRFGEGCLSRYIRVDTQECLAAQYLIRRNCALWENTARDNFTYTIFAGGVIGAVVGGIAAKHPIGIFLGFAMGLALGGVGGLIAVSETTIKPMLELPQQG